MRNLAVIPARGGSKRISKKNIKLFHGKPIISWVIEMSLETDFFDHVIVSTDSEEIAQISRSFGAQTPFVRPKSISDDNTSVFEVVRHAINYFNEKNQIFDLVTLIYPTAPFAEKTDIKRAINSINDYDFSIAVTLFPYPIQRALKVDDDTDTVSMVEKHNFLKRSQDLPSRYHDAGQFVVGKTKSWQEKTPLIEGKTLPIIVPRIRVQDIDEDEDWQEAEAKFSFIRDYNIKNKRF